MNQPTLKSKIIDIFDVYVPEGQSSTDTLKEINRRGKIDMVRITKILFMVVDEIDALKEQTKR
jgi:hypothetical protein